METALKYNGFTILATPREGKGDPGWIPDYTITSDRGTHTDEMPISSDRILPTEEAAIAAAFESGKRHIDRFHPPKTSN